SGLRIVATFSQLFLISHPEIRPFSRGHIALFVLSFSYNITETQEKGSPARPRGRGGSRSGSRCSHVL
ncbi:MAG TPA: hypothetical protein PKJ52_01045, partial [Rectinema sp.]|nr:hypothetical protein [Rectinema sp.]